MQQAVVVAEHKGRERRRVEAVVETLAHLRGQSESLAEVAHDVRNMVTALGLYCDLLEEPGVLAEPYTHYGSELRLVAAASRRLVEKLMALDIRQKDAPRSSVAATNRVTRNKSMSSGTARSAAVLRPAQRSGEWMTERGGFIPAAKINNLAGEVLANRNLLSALAGPAVALTVDAEGCSLPVRLTGEDLTRVLVNLVKNAAEAMPKGGRIQLGLRERRNAAGQAERMVLSIADNGPGIPAEALENIFASGFTTKTGETAGKGGWTTANHGFGLAITRSIVEEAGGRIHAANRIQGGAAFEIELPVGER